MVRIGRSILVFALAWTGLASADEGFWTYNQPPLTALKERYQFTPGPEWFEHLQKASVRFGRFGASASLISADGLLMTNHHVGEGQIFKLSTPERDLIAHGFLAHTRAEERKCPDLEIFVLQTITDVTDRVNAAIADGMDDAAASQARRKRISEIEQEGGSSPELSSEVVTLYRGARYHLYKYRRYTDVRLVFAPEIRAAAFGGDIDNFEFPRFSLDLSLFRVYDKGQPLHPEHYLHWSAAGSAEGELVFVSGHPGRTQRLLTVDHLKFLRDVQYPGQLRRLWRREVQLQQFCSRSEQNRRIGEQELQGVQNSRKAVQGALSGLQDPRILATKAEAEKKLRDAVMADKEHGAKWGDAWTRLSETYQKYRSFSEIYQALDGRAGGINSELFSKARTILRLTAEIQKPNGERLPEYQDARLESLYLGLYSSAPIHAELEIANLTSGLALLVETLGGDDNLVKAALAGKSPTDRAVELVSGTKLNDVIERRRLVEGGAAAVEKSADPLIRIAAVIDPFTRSLRKRYEDEVESVERDCYARIAAAQFTIRGENVYPDATGSLRLSFGTVKGYLSGGVQAPPFTILAGLFERATLRGPAEPFDLPQSWSRARDRLKLDTPYDLVCTADVIGGNSGSPLINRAGEVVGLIFDLNLDALIWDFVFSDASGRSVAIDSRGLIEALRVVYDAGPLVDEITGGSRQAAATR